MTRVYRRVICKEKENKFSIFVLSYVLVSRCLNIKSGTASVLIFEKRTGEKVSKNGHAQKAYEMRKNIINKVLKENLTRGERKIANRLLKKLNKAIWSWEEKI